MGKFDPSKGSKFTTYAYHCIKGAIKDYLRRIHWFHQKKRKELEKYNQAKEKLIQKLGREPARKEIAEELRISEGKVKEIERLQSLSIESLDEPYFTDDGTEVSRYEQISSPGPTPPDIIMLKELAKAVEECLETLPSEERQIIIKRRLCEKPLREVAEFMKMTIPTTQRREEEAARKLKDCLEKKGWPIKDLP